MKTLYKGWAMPRPKVQNPKNSTARRKFPSRKGSARRARPSLSSTPSPSSFPSAYGARLSRAYPRQPKIRAHGEDDVETDLFVAPLEGVDEPADTDSGEHGHEGAHDGLATGEPGPYVPGHGAGHPGVVERGQGVPAQQAEAHQDHQRLELHARGEQQRGTPQCDFHHAHGDDGALPPQVPAQNGHEKLHRGQQIGHGREEGDVGGVGAEVEGVAGEHGSADPDGLLHTPQSPPVVMNACWARVASPRVKLAVSLRGACVILAATPRSWLTR